MKATLEQVALDAHALSLEDQWKLVAHLIHDLDPGENLPAANIEIAWDAEISRRLEDLDSGKVKPIPSEEVFSRLQSRTR